MLRFVRSTRTQAWTLAVGLAPLLLVSGDPGARQVAHAQTGFSISWPQCKQGYPPAPFAVAIVGVNHGRPFSQNPCLASEYAWARSGGHQPGLYLNLQFGRSAVGPRRCGPDDTPCLAYNYGYNAAQLSFAYAEIQGVDAASWWLDIEMANPWSKAPNHNVAIIQGAAEYLRGRQRKVGVYSTPRIWREVTMDWRGGLAVWLGGADRLPAAARRCGAERSFGGGELQLIQYRSGKFDGIYLC